MIKKKKKYRNFKTPEGLDRFEVVVQETDLAVYTRGNFHEVAREHVFRSRAIIESYIKQHPDFLTTLRPWIIQGPAPKLIRKMVQAGAAASVGPMASVAGAVAEYVGKGLLKHCGEVIVENGGDIFIRKEGVITIGIYAGDSPLSQKVGIRMQNGSKPVAVCTSSGTVGHSFSFGCADAICVMAPSCALADAVATASANLVESKNDLKSAVAFASGIDGVFGVVAICDEKLAAWGEMELVSL